MATGEDEQALKEVEGMTLIGQIVHPDCRPVLEFGIVRPYDVSPCSWQPVERLGAGMGTRKGELFISLNTVENWD